MIDIDQFLEHEKEIINRALINNLPVVEHSVVNEAMRYSLNAGGKRLRPILTIAAAKTLGSEDESIIEVACALEYIHTYSLIHDDLPAMDDSKLRRGKPTCHCVYDDAVAILAGDGLLTLAFETVAKYGSRAGYEKKAIGILAELTDAAGVNGMIGGQTLDLAAEGNNLSLDEIDKISLMKTGVLLRAAVVCGGIAADASESQLKALSAFALNIGSAFQVVDDLLDYESTSEEMGKPAGADQVRAKATYPAVLGLDGARKRAEALYEQALTALDDLGRPTEILREIAKKLVYRTK